MSVFRSSLTYKPFKYPELVQIAEEHEGRHWVEDEIELAKDIEDFNHRLTDDERAFVTNVFKLFTQIDVEVGKGYLDYFIPNLKNNEVRSMLSSFVAREFIHQRSYALLNDTLGFDDSIYSEFLEVSEYKDKVASMRMERASTVLHEQDLMKVNIARTVFNEGVGLFSLFAMLLNFDRRGLMSGMCDIVRFSIIDENIHAEGMTALFKTLESVEKDKVELVVNMVLNDTIDHEVAVIEKAFEDYTIEGITKNDIVQYVTYMGQQRLRGLGYDYLNIEHPIPWIDGLVGNTLGQFFERRVTEYAKNGVYEGSFDIFGGNND